MSLAVVLASTTSAAAKPSPSSAQGLSPASVWIIVGIVALLLLLSVAVWTWIASGKRRLIRRLRKARPEGTAASLAARSAFARGDDLAVIDIGQADEHAAIKLLLAQSYARIGADRLAAEAASNAISAILTAPDWSDAEPTKGLSVLETRALRSWLDRLDGVDQAHDQGRLATLRQPVLGSTAAPAARPAQLASELDEIRLTSCRQWRRLHSRAPPGIDGATSSRARWQAGWPQPAVWSE